MPHASSRVLHGSHPLRLASALAVLAVLGDASLAQTPSWSPLALPTGPRTGFCGLAVDTLRGAIVYVGSDGGSPQTMEWNGHRWLVRAATGTPPPGAVLLAFDPQRARTVFVRPGDPATLEWDGANWTAVSTPHVPPGRPGAAVACDPVRGRVVLFGGGDRSFPHSDCWEYDGADWTFRGSAHAPTPRFDHAMAFDAARGKVVLFGGDDGVLRDDLWEWDGVDWTLRAAAVRPPARRVPGMAFDPVRQRIMLVGGQTDVVTVPLADHWEWDGANWTMVAATGLPTAAFPSLTLLAADPTASRMLLMRHDQTHTWDGTAWTRQSEVLSPGPTDPMVYDPLRDRAVMLTNEASSYARVMETREWNGQDWVLQQPAAASLQTYLHGLVHDEGRRRSVAFGGWSSVTNQLVATTYEWDGTTWTLRQLTASPPARQRANLAYDRARARIVLYGGSGPTGIPFTDTWTCDGATWTQVPGGPPGQRPYAKIAYDLARAETVMHGAIYPPLQAVPETWTFDGSQWVQRFPATLPAWRSFFSLGYDEARARVVLAGGLSAPGPNEVWEWNGVDWSPGLPAPVSYMTEPSLCFDRQRARLLLYDGWKTWALGVPGTAVVAPFGTGCGAPPLALAAGGSSRPVTGTTQVLAIDHAPLGSAVVMFGWSNAQVQNVALPYSLAPFGMPGCALLQSLDVTVFAGGSGNQASYAFVLPNVPAFVGLHLYTQAWASAPGQNAAAVITSNGLSLFVGSF